MKYYIESTLKYYSEIFPSPASVVSHMFATLGNGVGLDNKGYLRGNYKTEEAFEFPEPTPLTSIYPWTSSEEFQPFRELAGCRDVGFRDTAKYFIDCIKLTPDTVEGIQPWKDNLPLIEQVLLNTPTIQDEYTIDDMDKFLSKVANEKITNEHGGCDLNQQQPNSVFKHWFFDVQWSDCPECVEEEVKQSWCDRELGNDNFFWKATVNEELFEDYPNIYFWLKHKGVPDGEKVIIHWWW